MNKIKTISVILISTILTLVAITQTQQVHAAGSPLQISPVHNSVNCASGVFYSLTSYSFSYNGGTVKLSGLSDGTGTVYTDDQIDIEVTHPDTTKSTFSQDYGSSGTIVQTTPQNVTHLFKVGINSVKITMTNVRAPYCGSSAYWIVETAGGGGGAVKPNILPRSAWKGDNAGETTLQKPNRIVIHHTATSNIPGGTGTYLRELRAGISIDPFAAVIGTLDLTQSINKKGDYASVRGTWAGEIFLAWVEHKYLRSGYGDLGYQYLVDPNGTIYEGRWKGGLTENADNLGVAVEKANTGAISIAVLGKYGSDGKNAYMDREDGGIAKPTNATINSLKSLVDWLAGKYNINKTGQYDLRQNPGSCDPSVTNCNVNTIAGHKDFSPLTKASATECPGDLYNYIATLRGTSSAMPGGSMPTAPKPTGLLFGGFSPIVLGVVDPTGKRVGIDPASNQYINNIVGADHGSFGSLFDPDPEVDPGKSYAIRIPTTANGVYKIDVVGTGTGSFHLATEDLGSFKARVMKGNTTSGQKDNYQVIFNKTNPSALEMFHDTVPPVTAGTMTCSRDMQGICRSDATFKLNATDTGTNGDPASGVAKIECSYDNKATWQQCGDVNGATIVRNTNGTYSFWYRSTDRVLNVEAPKYSGVVDVEKFVSLATTALVSNLATGLKTIGIMHSNGNMIFTYNTNVRLDVLNYIGTFTQSGNTTFTYNTKTQVTQSKPLPSYPLSYYKTRCTNYTGAVTLWDTGTNFNKCIYATGDVTLNTTNTSGKLTVVSEGNIKDNSTGANLQAWDTTNGVLFYTAKTYTALANGAAYAGVIYAPNTQINGGLSNSTLNGGLYSKTINFNSGTSLTANQAASFPATTYNLPL